jgi:hypothetical protein
LRWRLIEDGADKIVLRLVGRTLSFPAYCAPALRTVLGGGSWRVGDLPLETDEDRVVLARRLLRESLVTPFAGRSVTRYAVTPFAGGRSPGRP